MTDCSSINRIGMGMPGSIGAAPMDAFYAWPCHGGWLNADANGGGGA